MIGTEESPTCWAKAIEPIPRTMALSANTLRQEGSMVASQPFFPKFNIAVLWYDRVCRVKSWA
jgi:hypothetical protein